MSSNQGHDIEKTIMNYVKKQFLVESGRSLTRETHLFREGIVDSIGVLLLVRFVEEHFNVQVDPAELVLKNFESVGAIRDFVLTHRAETAS